MSGLIVLAAGGTGGHIFPAEALAGELLGRGLKVALVTDKRGHAFGDRLPGVDLHRIRAGRPLRFPQVQEPSPTLARAVADRIWPCVMLQWEWLGGARASPAALCDAAPAREISRAA